MDKDEQKEGGGEDEEEEKDDNIKVDSIYIRSCVCVMSDPVYV